MILTHGMNSIKLNADPAYIILNQFINPMPSPRQPPSEGVYDYTITVPDFSEYPTEYQSDALVLSEIGDQLLDSDSPIDFTSKGIEEGTPFGIVYPYTNVHNDISYPIEEGCLSNGFTIEFWYKSAINSSGSQIQNDSNPWIIGLGTENEQSNLNIPNLILSLQKNPSDNYERNRLSLMLNGGSFTAFYNVTLPVLWSGNWHHYAMSYDSSKEELYLFFDGIKIKTLDSMEEDFPIIIDVINNATFLQGAKLNDEEVCPLGRFAQLALFNSCKWNDNFTVPTIAY